MTLEKGSLKLRYVAVVRADHCFRITWLGFKLQLKPNNLRTSICSHIIVMKHYTGPTKTEVERIL